MDSAEQASLSQLSEEKRNVRAAACHQLREIGPREQPSDEFEMAFQRNKHFDYLCVNTSFSCFMYPDRVSEEGKKSDRSFSLYAVLGKFGELPTVSL